MEKKQNMDITSVNQSLFDELVDWMEFFFFFLLPSQLTAVDDKQLLVKRYKV